MLGEVSVESHAFIALHTAPVGFYTSNSSSTCVDMIPLHTEIFRNSNFAI